MKRFPFFFFQLTQPSHPNSAKFPLCCFECWQPNRCSRSRLAKIGFATLEELFCYISLKKKQKTHISKAPVQLPKLKMWYLPQHEGNGPGSSKNPTDLCWNLPPGMMGCMYSFEIFSQKKKLKTKIKETQFTFWWVTHSVCIRYKSFVRRVYWFSLYTAFRCNLKSMEENYLHGNSICQARRGDKVTPIMKSVVLSFDR